MPSGRARRLYPAGIILADAIGAIADQRTAPFKEHGSFGSGCPLPAKHAPRPLGHDRPVPHPPRRDSHRRNLADHGRRRKDKALHRIINPRGAIPVHYAAGPPARRRGGERGLPRAPSSFAFAGARPGSAVPIRRYHVKAVVWHGIGDIRLDTVPDPAVQEPTDAVIRITRSAICGTDLHFVRGTMAPMAEGTVLGHEAVGVVEAVGADIRGFTPGDRRWWSLLSHDRVRALLVLPGRLPTPSATWPTRTARTRARASSAARSPPARSTACRRNTLVSRTRRPPSSPSLSRSPTTRRSWSRTSSRPAGSALALAEVGPGDTVAVFGSFKPGGAVRHRFRQAAGRRAGHGRGRHRDAAGAGPGAERRSDQLQHRGPV